jgi:hypothetical protein
MPRIILSTEFITYGQFVNLSISYPSRADSNFAVCLHYPALVDCVGGSTSVAVGASPPRKTKTK